MCVMRLDSFPWVLIHCDGEEEAWASQANDTVHSQDRIIL